LKNISDKTRAIESIDDLDINAFDDIKDYQKALIQVAHKEFERENQKKEDARRVQEIETKITEEFSKKMTKAAETNPEIYEAVGYINQFAEHIPAQTRYALLTEDNSAEVMYEIATTEGLLETIIRMNPLDAARKIAKISAKYDNQVQVPKASVVIPEKMPTKANTPNIAGKPTSGKLKYSDSMTQSEYKAWCKQEGIKI
jgi:hypothetical protein